MKVTEDAMADCLDKLTLVRKQLIQLAVTFVHEGEDEAESLEATVDALGHVNTALARVEDLIGNK